MRLTCPNCDAQYEVAEDAIPAGGRDVQCSNCGHAWYQYPLEAELALAEEEALFDAPEAAHPEAPPEAPLPEAAPQTAATMTAEPDHPDEGDDPDAAPGFEPPAPLHRRGVDEAVLSVLREEAEREVEQRRSETPPHPMETQPDLGLDSAAAAGALSPAARRIAQMKGIDPDAAPPAPPGKAAKGRDLLPDIEEINSTLQPSDHGDEAENPQVRSAHGQRRGAFRSGFLLMLLLAVALLLAYVMAPRIAEQMPGAAGAMSAYVDMVDAARMWLDGLIQKAGDALQSRTGG